jgi:hypothetical protein
MSDILSIKNNEVVIDDDQMLLPVWMDLYKSDTSRGKSAWKEWLTYIYFVYKKSGPYDFKLPTDRKRHVCVVHINRDSESYKHLDKILAGAIDHYVKSQVDGPSDEFLRKLYEDMDKFIEYLNNIPWSYKKKISVLVNIPDPQNPGEMMKMEQDVIVDIPNDDQKLKALIAVDKLLSLEEKFKEQRIEERRDTSARLFDKSQS